MVTPELALKYLLEEGLKYNCLTLSLSAMNRGKIESWTAVG